MYFFSGNEVLGGHRARMVCTIRRSHLAYAFEILDDGKRYRFHLRKGVQFQENYGEMTAPTWPGAWTASTGRHWLALLGPIPRPWSGRKRWIATPSMSSSKSSTPTSYFRMFDRASIVHSRKRWEEVGGADSISCALSSTG